MLDIEINGINLPLTPGIQTWQELLEELEAKHLGRGKVISSVHFDGNEIADFRGSDILGRSVHSIGQVRIEAIPMEKMVKEALSEADTYLASLQTSILHVAETFRRQLPDEANEKLSQVLHGIKMLAALLQGIELALSGQYQTGSGSVEQMLSEMAPTLEELITAQTQRDWILVSDILEFELLANLAGFEHTLAGFKQQIEIV